ncbi:unnamed protein product [Bathycoccus prasinos]
MAPKEFETPVHTIPVDSENKAMSLNIFSFQRPHHMSFHMSWIGFFISFVSTFAAAPMVPVIREDLNMTKPDLGNARWRRLPAPSSAVS